MLREGMRLASSVALLGAGAMADSVRVIAGDDAVEIRPRALRHLLLSFDDSIQGNIPAILGDDSDERVDTLVTLLRGTTDDDLRELLAALGAARDRLARERIRARDRNRDRRPGSRHRSSLYPRDGGRDRRSRRARYPE